MNRDRVADTARLVGQERPVERLGQQNEHLLGGDAQIIVREHVEHARRVPVRRWPLAGGPRPAGGSFAAVHEAFAAAKLTLSLRITGVRDDGYHEIDAEMATLDFGDRLEITEVARSGASGAGVRMLDDCGGDLPDACAPGDNLVVKALEMAGRDARVIVYKRIPAGAGLGGGSADAAAVLRWAGVTDQRRAVALGADVAFCLVGGRARVRGIGEALEPLRYVRERYTLLLAPLFCSTRAVYAAWDDLGGPTGPNGNDLEAAALRTVPEMARWRDELGEATGLIPRLAGSGSTWFVPGAHPGPRRVVATTTDRITAGA